jgi:hypothetical protein
MALISLYLFAAVPRFTYPVPGHSMWVLLTAYPIMVGGMVASGSQELIGKFGPIISTDAL